MLSGRADSVGTINLPYKIQVTSLRFVKGGSELMRTFESLFLARIAASSGLHVDLLIDTQERQFRTSNVEPEPTPNCTQTKCRPRPNQRFQRSTSENFAPELTGLSDCGDPFRRRSLTHISEQPHQPQFFTTHNLLKILRRGIRGFSDQKMPSLKS